MNVTFYIASYRRNRLKRIPEMMPTTFAFKDYDYPFDWQEEAPSNNLLNPNTGVRNH